MSIASCVRSLRSVAVFRGWRGALVLVLLLASLSATALTPRQAAAAWATTTSDVNLRWGPGTDSGVILVIPAGAGVNIVENQQNGFYRVRYEGQTGWVSADFLDRSGGGDGGGSSWEGETGTATVTSELNLRAGPSTSDEILDVMPTGATVTLAGVNYNGFASVVYNGVYGWAALQYLGGSSPAPSPGGATGTAYTTSELNLRAGPSTGDAVRTVMPSGATVTLTGTSSNGFRSIVYGGVEGWAAAEYLTTDGQSAPSPGGQATAAVTTSDLNLRSGPSTGSAVLDVMPPGAAISVTGDPQAGFYPVSYGGASGWAAAEFVSLDGGGEPAPVGGGILFPFSGEWTVIQGYNGGTHQNRDAFAQYYYAFDWARADGNTTGQPIYAPASGTVGFNDPNSGGIAIVMDNGYTVAMFHLTIDAGGLGYGAQVTQGQYLGYVSGPGGNGYAVTPHVETTLWAGDAQNHSAAPFSGANALSGVSFPDIGTSNQHYGTTVNP